MKNYTDITFILDRSGSMNIVKQATIDGFNSFLSEQKGKNDKVTLIQFDDEYETVYKTVPVKSLKGMETFEPRGMTALYDAIGRTIQETGKRLAAMNPKDRPERVVMVILTDGFENASHKFTQEIVARDIKHQQDNYNWKFLFIGANQDAILSARKLNIGYDNAINYQQGQIGTRNVFRAAGESVSLYCNNRVDLVFTEKQRKDAMEKDADSKS